MKILGVQFKNLNSLTGQWRIDFTSQEYAADGIFAITGPTGAGKTTILDAICLGLYGRTPRLDRVTKTTNEIMSRQSGDCFAEVTFETQKGRFRSHWSQHRARKKPDGELQPARHEVVDADTGEVLESMLSRVGAFIEEATGMDFGRFTRSMMLAQGEFAAFLSASPDDRAPILEQITGTEIYSEISIKVHERRKEEQEALALLKAKLEGIEILSPEQVTELEADLAKHRPAEKILIVNLEELRKAAHWLQGIKTLENENTDLDNQLADLYRRRQAFTPDLNRLKEARKALDLEGDYQAVKGLRSQQKEDTGECTAAKSLLPEMEKGLSEVQDRKKEAEKALTGAKKERQSQGPLIKKTRELDIQIKDKNGRIDEEKKSIKDGQRQTNDYRKDAEQLEKNKEKTASSLAAIETYQEENARDEALISELGVIRTVFDRLESAEAKRASMEKALIEAGEKKTLALKNREKTEAAHTESVGDYDRGEAAAKKLSEEIEAVLQGRDIGYLRDEADALKERLNLLKQAYEAMERAEKTGEAITGLEATLEKKQIEIHRLSGEIEKAKAQQEQSEKEIFVLETEVTLRSRIRDLEEERRRLEDGKPCPLCGATDHPFARGNVPELDRAEADLRTKKVEMKTAAGNLDRLEKEKIETESNIRHSKQVLVEKQAALDKDEEAFVEILFGLGIKVPIENRMTAIHGEVEAAEKNHSAISKTIISADEKIKKEVGIRVALEKSREKRDALSNALQDARHHLENAEIDHGRLAKESDTILGEAKDACNAALALCRPFGIDEIPRTDLNALFSGLSDRKNAWLANVEKKTSLEKELAGLNAALDKNSALLERLDADLQIKGKNLESLVQERDSLVLTRREIFGEKDPDREEGRLANAEESAGTNLEKAKEIHGQIQNEKDRIENKISELKERIEKRALELARLESLLKDRIIVAGFEDEPALLAARLDKKERDRLAEQEASLVRDQTALDARKKDKTAALADEREKKLTDLSTEVLTEKIDTCETDLKQVRARIVEIEKSLSDDEQRRKTQETHISKIDKQKTECDQWDNLHQLIGSADGKKFRNFAQGLTFEVVTAHANGRLREMTDRYLLVRDPVQPLELNVIDNYQAGEVRSTKNLSGGESFVVSLALALGLAGMAGRNVRVDSLFLDEGFGTLDDESLETALSTLSGLHQDGKVIGVISHVAALKERIGTRIEVTPGPGGRSRIAGPGCLQI